jgi:RND superfamily putative drug exporter
MARVVEEQKRLGTLEDLRLAPARTGGIITSCGVFMAGTCALMMTGHASRDP